MNARIKAWQDLSFGMFIHLGVYSQFGGVYQGEKITQGYSEQIMQFAPIPKEKYLQMAQTMTLEAFEPDDIISLAKSAGMNYLVVTAKHHDGFCMYDTQTTSFNVVKQTPFAEDVIKKLADACRQQEMRFGVYFSLVDWNLGHDFDPNNFNSISREIEDILCRQLTELVCHYGELCELWFDMASPSLRQSLGFKSIVRKYQPMAMINGRIGNAQGDFITFWDNEIPEEAPDKPWQTPQSIYPETWGYRSWQVHEDPKKRADLLFRNYKSVTQRKGNYLLNIGPKGDGSVSDFERQVLIELGEKIRAESK